MPRESGGSEEEYEIIPSSPLRRLERRIEKVESTTSTSEIRKLIEQIIELIKANQRIIDDVVKANSELVSEVGAIPGKIDSLVSTLTEFIELLKASATEEAAAGMSRDIMDPVVKKMEELIDQNKRNAEISQATLTALDTIDKRLKRLYYPAAPAGQR